MSSSVTLALAAGFFFSLVVWTISMLVMQESPKQRVYKRLRALTSGEEETGPAISTLSLSKPNRASDLSRSLLRLSWGQRIQLWIEQAGVSFSIGAFILSHLCLMALGFMIGASFLLHPYAVLFLMLGIGALPSVVVYLKRQKRFTTLSSQLPEAIRLMSSSLRAGLGLDSGIEIVARELAQPISGEFQKLLNERRLYSDANEAFRRLAQRLPVRDFRLFVSAASLHREVGGNFAELLDQLEATVRGRFRLQRELKTLTAESRISGIILGIFPLVVGFGILILNPSYYDIMLEEGIGRLLLYAAFGLQIIGFIVIKVLTSPRID